MKQDKISSIIMKKNHQEQEKQQKDRYDNYCWIV